MSDSDRPAGIVVDGHKRLYEALHTNGTVARIRAEVEAEFARRIQVASFWRRWQLRRQMEQEIKRRLARLAPPHALY